MLNGKATSPEDDKADAMGLFLWTAPGGDLGIGADGDWRDFQTDDQALASAMAEWTQAAALARRFFTDYPAAKLRPWARRVWVLMQPTVLAVHLRNERRGLNGV